MVFLCVHHFSAESTKKALRVCQKMSESFVLDQKGPKIGSKKDLKWKFRVCEHFLTYFCLKSLENKSHPLIQKFLINSLCWDLFPIYFSAKLYIFLKLLWPRGAFSKWIFEASPEKFAIIKDRFPCFFREPKLHKSCWNCVKFLKFYCITF